MKWTIVAVVVVFCYSIAPNLWTRCLGRVIREGTGVDAVWLTFDDGPDPRYTPALLDTLAAYDVKATFFVLSGKALRFPDIIKRMMAEGHAVEIHGERHWFVPLLPPATTRQQARGAAEQIWRCFGVHPAFYRPTWGLCNAWSFLPSSRGKLRLVTWSVMVGDWRVTSADQLLQRLDRKVRPGSIIVLHDSDETFGAQAGAPERVIRAIPGLVELVQHQGLVFRTMNEWP